MRRNWWLKGLCGAAALALLAVSGCTGSDPLSNGNVAVAIEVLTEGTTDEPYDCTLWTINELSIRPLDGTCTGGPADGEPCFNNSDCAPGICEDAQARTVIGENGLFVGTGPKGNLEGTPCAATLDSGFGRCTWECAPGAGDPPCPIFPKQCDVNDPSPETTCDPSLIDPDGVPNTCVPRYSFQANAGAFAPPNPMVLSAGLYEIVNLRVGPAGLYEDNPGGGLAPVLKWCGNATSVAGQYDTEDLRFTVVDDQTTLLRFVIHVDALEDSLPNAQSCADFQANITSINEIQAVP